MSKQENLIKEIQNIDRKIKVLQVQRTLLKNKLSNKMITEQQQERRNEELPQSSEFEQPC